MGKAVPLEGNNAIAEAMRQINPDVVAAYPITPSTEIVQTFAKFVSDGKVNTNYVAVESEHSALSACTAAAAAGGRVMNATSSQGLALMWEILYITASLRLPMVLSVVNRTLSGNINIHCDHSDGMGARDSGWIQIYGENAQEGYDNCLQAVTIGERSEVRLPVMNCIDGFLVSHAYEMVEVEDDKAVADWIGPYQPVRPLLDLSNPISIGPLDLWDFYFEHKRNQLAVYGAAQEAIVAEGKRFGQAFGREYGLMECVELEDAELAIVALGSTAGMCKDVVAELRDKGVKAGLLKLRVFRPFPAAEIAAALKGCQAVAVLDRASSPGYYGPLYGEVASALFTHKACVPTVDIIYGLGGREIRPEHIAGVFDTLKDLKSSGQPADPVSYLGVRE